MNVIIATDVGSTTSKARLFKRIDGEWRFVVSGEAPTTVEAPYEDVTRGVLNALKEIEELTGHKLIAPEGGLLKTRGPTEGVDLYVTTSSAGGGLQIMVGGVVKSMSAESAERAALGAGAIIMDVIATDDGREPYEKIDIMRFLRPDMILLAGGTDGGTVSLVTQIAELIANADPKPRLGMGYSLPIIYSGNKYARDNVEKIFKGRSVRLEIVENIRPTLEEENPGPAREAIHQLFMEHVMSHAPGYTKLMKWTDIPIMPTPSGEGRGFQTIARMYKTNVVGVGLGGATTNVYSVYDGKFVRSVSANLGLSYSICNVLKSTGIDNIIRWIPHPIEPATLRNRLLNKMIRPTIIPATLEDMQIEHAVAREAIRLGFQHHKFLARPLRGTMKLGDMGSKFSFGVVYEEGETYIDMMKVGLIGGTGGLLSHAPERIQSALILIDSFQPEGLTRLVQDSVFMIPHLGVLSTVYPEAAMQVFERDCLVRLGTCIAFAGRLNEEKNMKVGTLTFDLPDGESKEIEPEYNTITKIELNANEKATVKIKPRKEFNVGAGPGKEVETTVEGGVVGVIVDARGRPLQLPKDEEKRMKMLKNWFKELKLYPSDTG